MRTFMLSVCVCVSTERNKNQPFYPHNNLIYASQQGICIFIQLN